MLLSVTTSQAPTPCHPGEERTSVCQLLALWLGLPGLPGQPFTPAAPARLVRRVPLWVPSLHLLHVAGLVLESSL